MKKTYKKLESLSQIATGVTIYSHIPVFSKSLALKQMALEWNGLYATELTHTRQSIKYCGIGLNRSPGFVFAHKLNCLLMFRCLFPGMLSH